MIFITSTCIFSNQMRFNAAPYLLEKHRFNHDRGINFNAAPYLFKKHRFNQIIKKI